MSSSAESEVAGLFLNAQYTLSIRFTREDMGHPQPTTVHLPLQTDDLTGHKEYYQVYTDGKNQNAMT